MSDFLKGKQQSQAEIGSNFGDIIEAVAGHLAPGTKDGGIGIRAASA